MSFSSPLNRRNFLKAGSLAALSPWLRSCKTVKKRPNILFCISDDQSWAFAGTKGGSTLQTPAFARVAREGVLFNHAYCACSSCTPSRGSILTGQPIWRLQEGGNLAGFIRAEIPVYPDLLEATGYMVGYTGKGWGPGPDSKGGRTRNPAGPEFNRQQNKTTIDGILPVDYAANFADFLQHRQKDQPFCFWFGATEPHLPLANGRGLALGKSLQDVEVPTVLPDCEPVRSVLLDYFSEIEWFDLHLGRMIEQLEKSGELENTLIVVTSDNGMPFPGGKGTCYDYGVRMPLAIRWGARVKGGREVDDLVSLCDLAPTFLQACGVQVPDAMIGKSVLNILESAQSGFIDKSRDAVVTARERHTLCRPHQVGYPVRAIRTHDYLYVHNYEPERWPAGDPDIYLPNWTEPYGDIDSLGSGIKSYMLQHQNDPHVSRLFQRVFGKRPAEELYDLKQDPDQLVNVASQPAFAEIKNKLGQRLKTYLRQTGDPRETGATPIWDTCSYG